MHFWNIFAPPDAPQPTPEYAFAPPRKWRTDFCWIEQRLMVEMQGGTWNRGRHSRGKGMTDDYEKANAATLQGWRTLYYTTDMLSADPIAVIGQVCAALGVPMEVTE